MVRQRSGTIGRVVTNRVVRYRGRELKHWPFLAICVVTGVVVGALTYPLMSSMGIPAGTTKAPTDTSPLEPSDDTRQPSSNNGGRRELQSESGDNRADSQTGAQPLPPDDGPVQAAGDSRMNADEPARRASAGEVERQTQDEEASDEAPLDSVSPFVPSRFSYHDGIRRVAPSVVSVYASREQRIAENALRDDSDDVSQQDLPAPSPRRLDTRQGSGVIVESDGLVLTNFHLVENADAITIVLGDGSRYPGQLVGGDPETDLAVVRIDARMLPSVDYRNAPVLRVGDIVLAIGNPFGVGQTVTQGIVSATRRRVSGASAWQNFVQIDAAINPGNSGGALITPDGRLVGINTAVFRGERNAMGIGFAIPAELLSEVVPEIIATGRVSRGWLGAGVRALERYPALARRHARGAVVSAVLAGGPAATAGLQDGDLVVTLDGQPVDGDDSLLLMISAQAPGTTVSLGIVRQSRTRPFTVDVTLGERPAQP